MGQGSGHIGPAARVTYAPNHLRSTCVSFFIAVSISLPSPIRYSKCIETGPLNVDLRSVSKNCGRIIPSPSEHHSARQLPPPFAHTKSFTETTDKSGSASFAWIGQA